MLRATSSSITWRGPGFLGGGQEKAEVTARHIAGISPAEGQWAEAKLAEKRKEMSSAEAHLRQAIELAPAASGKAHRTGSLSDETRPLPGSRTEFRAGRKGGPDNPRLIFAEAETYVKAHRNLDVASNY